MGNCSSCLGARHRSIYDDDEDTRLFFDDPDNSHYGTFGDSNLNGGDDTEEAHREFEALQSVVAWTSNNMVDVFEISSSRYQSLLSKLSTSEEIDPEARVEEYPEPEDSVNMHNKLSLARMNDGGPFVGNFVDAAEATI